MRIRVFIAAPLIAALAACGALRPAPPSASSSAPSTSAAPAARTTLAGEQVRLAELFRDTPVTFKIGQDGSLRATVPRRFSFDAGTTQVKPPLGAVLDRLAKGQSSSTSRMRVSAPSDPGTRGGNLARDRALSVRDYLAAQGIAASRLHASGARQTELVEIVISEGY